MVEKKTQKSKTEKEITKLKSCLKEKDERLNTLERTIKYLEEKGEDFKRWFNFSSLVALIGTILCIITFVCLMDPSLAVDILMFCGIMGLMSIVLNFLLSAYALTFDDEKQDDSDIITWYVILNGIMIPIIILIAAFMWLLGFPN